MTRIPDEFLLSNPPRRKKAPFGPAVGNHVLDAIRETDRRARRERVPVALIGGFAMRAWGSPRLTDDVDLAATRMPRFASTGAPLPNDMGRRSWTPSGLAVDVIPGGPLYADAARKSKRTRWGFRLASPEHLAVMKLEAGREKDVSDLRWLLGQEGLVNGRKASALAGRFLGRDGRRAMDAEIARVRGFPGKTKKNPPQVIERCSQCSFASPDHHPLCVTNRLLENG